MKQNLRVLPLVVSIAAACTLPPVSAAGGGFIKDSSATLPFRNCYFSRDVSDIVGPNKQSKALRLR